MDERNRGIQEAAKKMREDNIRKRVQSDAFDYINRVRKSSPESLKFGEPFNQPEAEAIMRKSKKDLELQDYEIQSYLFALIDTVNSMLKVRE